MNEDKTFAAENPFLRLDKRLFRSGKDGAEDTDKAVFSRHAGAKARVKAPLNGPYAGPDSESDTGMETGPDGREEAAFREAMRPGDLADADAFLSAVAGVTPLDAGRAAPGGDTARVREKTPAPRLSNPVLSPGSAPSPRRPSRAGATVAVGAQGKGAGRPLAAPDALPDALPEASTSDRPVSRREQRRRESRQAVERARERPPQNEELAFASAMQDVTPLAGKGRAVPPEIIPPAMPPALPEESNPLQDFMEGKLEFALESTDEYVEGHILGLDLMTVGKLQAGQYSPESHLDLHGLNAEQAFQSLVGFIKGAYLKGQRTVLVVPGRGRNSPQGMPVLRSKVQHWFTQEPFRRVVLAFCTARPADGGAGALYVLLRKLRKDRGKVYWDRRPADPDLL